MKIKFHSLLCILATIALSSPLSALSVNAQKAVSKTWNPNLKNGMYRNPVIDADNSDPDEKVAGVIVPDYQLSLAIGKEGQNARLAARLTGYKIDIKSETQAIECGDLPENYMEQMGMVGEEGYTVGEEEEEYDDVPADAADEDGADEIEFVETDEE